MKYKPNGKRKRLNGKRARFVGLQILKEETTMIGVGQMPQMNVLPILNIP